MLVSRPYVGWNPILAKAERRLLYALFARMILLLRRGKPFIDRNFTNDTLHAQAGVT